MKKNTSIQFGKKNFDLISFTGEVLNYKKHFETKVSGSGGGGFVNRGSGFTAPVSVRSETIIHDQIFLKDKDNTESIFNLIGFDIACREGHILKIISAGKENKKKREAGVVNLTTSQIFVNKKALRKIVGPSFLIPILITIITTFAFLSSLIIGPIVFLIWHIRRRTRVKRFISQVDFLQI